MTAYCYLSPGRWTRLPGTGVEVYLTGKMRSHCEGVGIFRTGKPGEFGGWDLNPVWQRVFIRRVRP